MPDRMEQILQIDPPVELVFRGSYTEVCKTTLRLTNPSDKRVLFKVKTTAPKSYCVRPNSGIISQGGTQEVDVMLQSGEISDQDRSKHKFMVQTMFAPSHEETFSDAVWKDITKDKLMDTRLKCVFIEEPPPPEGPRPEPVSTATSVESSSLTPIVEDKIIEPSSEEPTSAVPPPQTNAGSTPTTAPPSTKDGHESAQQAAKVRMFKEKVDKLSSENTDLKVKPAIVVQ